MKHLFTMTMMALLMAGCSQNEVMETSPDAHPAIGFKVYTGNSTRGTNTTTTSMQTSHFGLLAYYTGKSDWATAKGTVTSNFMYNTEVKYESGKWVYSPVKYWPNNTDEKISFFAYAPYNDQTTTNKGIVLSDKTVAGIPTIKFSLKTADLTNMVDLVVDNALDRTQTISDISFNFRHILTKVLFNAKLGADVQLTDGSAIYITDIEILGSKSIGGGTDKKDYNSASKFYTTANWKDLKWNYDDGTVIAESPVSLKSIMDMVTINTIDASGTTGTTTGVKITTSATDVTLFKNAGEAGNDDTQQYLYLIPPGENKSDFAPTTLDIDKNNLPGMQAEGDIMLKISYDIASPTTLDSNKFNVSHNSYSVGLPEGSLARNTFYTFTFIINMKEITVKAAEVKSWENKTGDLTVE